MQTSAHSLIEILSHIHDYSPSNARFLSEAAAYLGFEGDLAEVDAAKVVIGIYQRVRSDIDQLETDEDKRKELKKKLSAFKGLETFGFLSSDVATAKSNFLKAERLVNLQTISSALRGNVEHFELDRETQALSTDIKDLAARVRQSGLPDRGSEVFARRLLQVASAIEHYELFGSDGLEEKLQALLGSIAFYRDSSDNHEDKALFDKALSVAGRAIEGLKKADDSVSVSLSLYQKGAKAMEFIASGGSGVG